MEVHELKVVQRKMVQIAQDLKGSPVLQAMRDVTLLVTRSARQHSPVNTGRLRASIVPEVTQRDTVITGVVGSNVVYAPYMELGTGTFAGRKRHAPFSRSAIEALSWWARRVQSLWSGRAIAYFIWRKGGLEPREFLKNALEDNRGKIEQIFSRAVGKIIRP